jgi:hypothetical protein
MVLASPEHFSTPIAFAVDATYVYWSRWTDGHNAIERVRKTGGDVEQIGTSEITGEDWGGHDIVSDDTNVYWLHQSRIMKTPVQGGDGQLMAGGFLGPLAVDATDIYVALTYGGAISRVPKTGGVPRAAVSFTAPKGPQIVALHGDYVYWGNVERPFIQRAKKDGGPIETLDADDYALSIAVDDENLYASCGSYNDTPGCGLIAVSVDHSHPPIALGPSSTGPIAIAGAHVYVTDDVAGTIVKASKTGGKSEVLASGQRGASVIATDSDCVYWARTGSPSAIVRSPL